MIRFLSMAGLALGLIGASVPAHAMDVYLFRGLAGIPFSVGLDKLEKEITSSGIHAETHGYTSWPQVYQKIIHKGSKEVALIGHSMGALSIISLTKKLRGSGIRVAYLGFIDIPMSRKSVPSNAPWAEAYISTQPGFYSLKTSRHQKNLVVNTRVSGTVHITIDDSRRVHDAILSAVWLADASSGRTPKTVAAFAPVQKTGHEGLDMMMTGSVKK